MAYNCWIPWGLRVTNYKDFQAEWAILDDTNKPWDSLGEVTELIIYEFYDEKKLFDKKYHQRWAEELCDAQIATRAWMRMHS